MKKKLCALLMTAAMTVYGLAACGTDTGSVSPSGSGTSDGDQVVTTESVSSDSTEAEAGSPEETTTVTEYIYDENDPDGTHIVIDHAGDEVEVPNRISRIAIGSFYPLASVTAEYLGSADAIVGIHPVSMSAAKNGLLGQVYPEILDANTDFIAGSEVNIEELLKIDPDIVIGVGKEQAQAIREAGIPALTVSASAWEYDLFETYDNWADLLDQVFGGSPVAEKVQKDSAASYEYVQSVVSEIPEEEQAKVLVLFQYSDAAMVASGVNFFGQKWCDYVNAYNVASEVENGIQVQISMEQVYEWDPDVIIITNFCGTQPEDLYNNAIGNDDWSTVSAVKEKRVYKMPLGLYRSYTPGGDTPVTVKWLAQTVYPELFADMDIREEARNYYKDLLGYEFSDEQLDMMFNPSRNAADGL
ncbi:MAG: ABC transporter substrate-binding protein [Lachnospiraceae bacterium]|nr:ABC transporter substrate-binding protein [Lachnospiraceae bacterium]